jgi:hypothetical protein
MVSFGRVLASGLAISSWAGLAAANPIVLREGEGDVASALASIVKTILGAIKEGTEERTVLTYVGCPFLLRIKQL